MNKIRIPRTWLAEGKPAWGKFAGFEFAGIGLNTVEFILFPVVGVSVFCPPGAVRSTCCAKASIPAPAVIPDKRTAAAKTDRLVFFILFMVSIALLTILVFLSVLWNIRKITVAILERV